MDRVVRAAREAGARPLGGGLFADPLGAVFGLSVTASPSAGHPTGASGGSAADPAINSVTDPAAASAAVSPRG